MKVAVVIPCYNVAEYLPRALASVEAQTYRDLEVVCVDDGSVDDTAKVINEHKVRSKLPFRYIFQENQGACAARNTGVRSTGGEYLQFLDADDALEPDKVAGQLKLIQTSQGLPDLVVGDYEAIQPNGQLIAKYALHGKGWMGLIKTRLGTTSANLFRRSAFEQAGGWSNRMRSSQDYELMFRLLQNDAQLQWDERVSTHVLKRVEGSISRTNMKANWHRYIDLRKDIRTHLQTKNGNSYGAEIAVLDQYIFMAIRVLSTFDIDEAEQEYKRSIPRGFVPEVSKAITEKYVLFHRLMGYSMAERMLRRFKPEPTPL